MPTQPKDPTSMMLYVIVWLALVIASLQVLFDIWM